MTKWFDEIDSTNNQIVRDKFSLEDKSVYAALHQSAGKGQRGNVWVSGYGENLLFSILFKPSHIAANKQFIISQAVTLGIVDYLKNYNIEAKIKWPNDIYVENLKICGILIENSVAGDKLAYSIVGIGININQTFFDGALNPTSVILQTGNADKYDVKDELDKVLSYIFRYYDLTESQPSTIESLYLERMYRINEIHRFIDLKDSVEFEGKITGIDQSSCLLIEYSDGSLRRFAFKEIAYII